MSKVTRHQVRRRVSRIITENFALAAQHTGNEQCVYAVSHPRMKKLYEDIAYLGKAIQYVERNSTKNKVK